ncbi:hypothetical protein HCR76_15375 [Paramicrobacterium chengjingii]|uniref:Uncharacterized protein n=1 Tax=Paramicrobacterium chengjingii TaxID=2769067 RepID=A0ABX6YHA9_9MICO|nr:hypothetical protein [Microbacterium chengjingii]QPZ38148.1 hypothetical protein HCR76_15375 [Microbacterium chengjingii]
MGDHSLPIGPNHVTTNLLRLGLSYLPDEGTQTLPLFLGCLFEHHSISHVQSYRQRLSHTQKCAMGA